MLKMGVLQSIECDYMSFERIRRLGPGELQKVAEADAIVTFLNVINSRDIVDPRSLFEMVSRAVASHSTCQGIHRFTSNIPFDHVPPEDQVYYAHVYALVLFMRCLYDHVVPVSRFAGSDLLNVACQGDPQPIMSFLSSIDLIPRNSHITDPAMRVFGPNTVVDRLDRLERRIETLCDAFKVDVDL